MEIKKGRVYIADLNPRIGTEPGKVRPVVVVQTDLLNGLHPSTVICPITTQVHPKAQFLRVHLATGEGGMNKPSDILVDQIRAVDNRRFVKSTGKISGRSLQRLLQNLRTLIS
jgi:mRNA interferase MazF